MTREEELIFYESMLEMIHKIVYDFAAEYHGGMDSLKRRDAYNKAYWELSILKDYIASLQRIGLLKADTMDSIHRRVDDTIEQITRHSEDEDWPMD